MKYLQFFQEWERAFVSKKSFRKRFFVSLLLASLGLAFISGIYHFTGLYFSSLIISIVISISLYSGFYISMPFAIGLSLIGDYYYLQPIGSVFDSIEGYEHFIIITGVALFCSYLISKLRFALQRMTQSKAEADRATFMMEKILALVSHDIRNPLTTTKLGIQMVLKGPEHVERNTILLNKILDNIDIADSMIQSLLDVSRIRAGKTIPLYFEACDLKKEVARMIEDMSFTLSDRLIFTSEIDMLPGSWAIRGLRRVIENLITNAVKYGSEGTPITIKLSQIDEYVLIAVHNEGKPISPEAQKKLFDSYHRTEEVEQGTIQGWGLGLTLVKGVAEAHQGTVYIESTPEKGTNFILKLPLNGQKIKA